MTGLLTGLVSLVVFGLVILVHELGHFWAARHCGIRVEEFSIGFGPTIASWQRGGTRYTLRLLPLGGYNLFSNPPEMEEGEAPPPVQPPVKRRGLFPVTVSNLPYEEAGPWQRFFVTLWGAVMNFLLGFVVLLVLVFSMANLGGTTVAQFIDGAASAATGLQVGDTILEVDGGRCRTANSLAAYFDGTEQEHTLTVLRGGELLTLTGVTVAPTTDEEGNILSGVDFRVAAVPKNLRNVLAQTREFFGYYSTAILGGFWQLATGQVGVEQLSGPIGTVSAVSQAVQYGWRDVLSLMALLTINVGIFNLLPIPALDGCKLIFLLFEGVTGKAVPQKFQIIINTAGVVALLWLMLLVTMQDITRFL
ncbi:RIP metalloprotease [uncultured Subdoligranulum sp.]|uniref:M50 family metallopeptidase n=1 Tax=uncultured Subdoligranulum sp. TaxID=512298 RepID=UPI0026298E47|nr:site-2 protease family protein [uncultured Subdoligranulum sp.]